MRGDDVAQLALVDRRAPSGCSAAAAPRIRQLPAARRSPAPRSAAPPSSSRPRRGGPCPPARVRRTRAGSPPAASSGRPSARSRGRCGRSAGCAATARPPRGSPGATAGGPSAIGEALVATTTRSRTPRAASQAPRIRSDSPLPYISAVSTNGDRRAGRRVEVAVQQREGRRLVRRPAENVAAQAEVAHGQVRPGQLRHVLHARCRAALRGGSARAVRARVTWEARLRDPRLAGLPVGMARCPGPGRRRRRMLPTRPRPVSRTAGEAPRRPPAAGGRP